MPIHRLDCAVKHYDWGSPTVIPELLGVDNPDARPFAELWIGAHPGAPSTLESGESLADHIAADPRAVLGDDAVRVHGEALPFLLKILAAAAPLSIQCHPDAARARAGFAREEAAGIPRDAPHRCYRDASHKPELVVALEPFTALSGFREPDDIADRFAAAGIETFADEAATLRAGGDLGRFFAVLMRADESRRAAALGELARGHARVSGSRWLRALLERYPGDLGCLAPLYLHLVELRAGDALYLPARELHAYLEGTAIEIMASSDNVLRGGLTSKHVDVGELLGVLRFLPSAPRIIAPSRRGDGTVTFACPADEFALAYLDVDGAIDRAPRSLEILLCTEGRVEITGDGAQIELSPGRAALIDAATPSYELAGTGRVYLATPC